MIFKKTNKPYLKRNRTKKNIIYNYHDIDFNTIKNRIYWIKKITDGKIKISDLKLKYPLRLKKVNSVPEINNKNSPNDILYQSFKSRDLKLLSEDMGSYGIPYQICFNNCFIPETYKLGLKIISIEKNNSDEIDKIRNKSKDTNNFLDFLSLSSESKELEISEIFKSNPSLSCNVEIRVIYKLSKLVYQKKTPHINLPLLSFRDYLSNLYKEFKKEKQIKLNKYFNYANILLSEWCFYGSLDNFLKSISLKKINKYLETIIFQIIYTLMVIQQEYPNFRHNDLNLRNILVDRINKKSQFLYQIIYKDKEYSFEIPNFGFQTRLWDFDYSSIEGSIDNLKILGGEYKYYGIEQVQNRYYDLFSFCYELLSNYKNNINPEILDFFDNQIFKKLELSNQSLVNKRFGRILINQEVTTPKKIFIEILNNNKNIFRKFMISQPTKTNYSEIYKFNLK